ncbi:MAG: hypothetical protein ACI978_002487 [Oleispira sp.]
MKSVNELRKFSGAKNVELGVESETSDTAQTSHFSIAKLLLLAGSLLGLPTAYVHFFGFSYLKGKLETLGFDYVDVDLSIQEGFYIAVEGFYPALISVLKLDFTLKPNLFLAVLIPILLVPLMFYLMQRFPSVVVKASEQSIIESVFYRSKTIKGMFLQMPVVGAYIGSVFLGILVLLLGVGLSIWLLAALGMAAGQAKGKEIFLENVCMDASKTSDPNNYQSCRKIKTSAGLELEGRIIYRNDKYLYFITNNGAYELTNSREVNMHVEYVKKPVQAIK